VSVSTFAAAQLLRALPRVQLSRAVGRLCEASLSPGLSQLIERAYVRAYRVDMAEVAPPGRAYPTFDAFFTRPLKPGARQIDDAPVVSPSDGSVQASGPIGVDGRIRVKGRPYGVGELVGDEETGSRYAEGSFAVVYLSPRDYHRVHAPVRGNIATIRGIAGDLYPVNSIGERHVHRLLVRNRRVAIAIDSDRIGRVTVVMVGAVVVGRITVNALPGLDNPVGTFRIDPPMNVLPGDEIGTFHLGSTAVLLLEPGLKITRSNGPVRYGESLVKGS
jgi:phosphatidylserine decarboxylase